MWPVDLSSLVDMIVKRCQWDQQRIWKTTKRGGYLYDRSVTLSGFLMLGAFLRDRRRPPAAFGAMRSRKFWMRLCSKCSRLQQVCHVSRFWAVYRFWAIDVTPNNALKSPDGSSSSAFFVFRQSVWCLLRVPGGWGCDPIGGLAFMTAGCS